MGQDKVVVRLEQHQPISQALFALTQGVDPTPDRRQAVYLPTVDKYRRLTRRLSQGQKGLEERALMASQQPSEPW